MLSGLGGLKKLKSPFGEYAKRGFLYKKTVLSEKFIV